MTLNDVHRRDGSCREGNAGESFRKAGLVTVGPLTPANSGRGMQMGVSIKTFRRRTAGDAGIVRRWNPFRLLDCVSRSAPALILSCLIGACGAVTEAPPEAEDRDVQSLGVMSERAIEPVAGEGRGASDQKGSLLFYPHVEIKWDAANQLRQDTILAITNDYAEDVEVQLYFVNGDVPAEPVFVGNPPVLVERAHPGWNVSDVQFRLTGDESTYWSSYTGLPKGLSSFMVLDPGNPPGRPDPDPDNPGGRVLRGYVIAWAVDNLGREIRWNHLSGSAVLIDYITTSASEYSAWGFQAIGAVHGQQPESCLAFNLDSGQCVDRQVVSGRIDLDGFEYDACPGRLLLDFNAVGAPLHPPAGNAPLVGVDTNLTLVTCSVDLRQDNHGPVTTKAKFDIWNQNEVRFSGTERCVTCWDMAGLASYTTFGIPNHFLLANLQTGRGRAKIDGLASTVCPGIGQGSQDAAILGMSQRVLRFPAMLMDAESPNVAGVGMGADPVERTAETLVGQGEEVGQVLYDLIVPPQELRNPNDP